MGGAGTTSPLDAAGGSVGEPPPNGCVVAADRRGTRLLFRLRVLSAVEVCLLGAFLSCRSFCVASSRLAVDGRMRHPCRGGRCAATPPSRAESMPRTPPCSRDAVDTSARRRVGVSARRPSTWWEPTPSASPLSVLAAHPGRSALPGRCAAPVECAPAAAPLADRRGSVARRLGAGRRVHVGLAAGGCRSPGSRPRSDRRQILPPPPRRAWWRRPFTTATPAAADGEADARLSCSRRVYREG